MGVYEGVPNLPLMRPTRRCATARSFWYSGTSVREGSRKIAIFVEPSPFSHVSGYQNRFKSMIKHMREEGDEVLVVTPQAKDEQPRRFLGARVLGVMGIKPPFYKVRAERSGTLAACSPAAPRAKPLAASLTLAHAGSILAADRPNR